MIFVYGWIVLFIVLLKVGAEKFYLFCMANFHLMYHLNQMTYLQWLDQMAQLY